MSSLWGVGWIIWKRNSTKNINLVWWRCIIVFYCYIPSLMSFLLNIEVMELTNKKNLRNFINKKIFNHINKLWHLNGSIYRNLNEQIISRAFWKKYCHWFYCFEFQVLAQNFYLFFFLMSFFWKLCPYKILFSINFFLRFNFIPTSLPYTMFLSIGYSFRDMH